MVIQVLWMGMGLSLARIDAASEMAGRGRSPEAKGTTGPKVILFFGDSLTAGYGIDPGQAFPAIIQDKIKAAGWDFVVVNAGLSGETTAGGVRRIEWVLNRKVDVLVLALGGNDGLRGIPVETTRQNLQTIIDQTRSRYPQVKIVVAGMQAPPNLGPEFTSRFREVSSAIAGKNGASLIPFLLQGVACNRELNQLDGIHPTVEGHRLLAQNVWKVLQPLLRNALKSPVSR